MDSTLRNEVKSARFIDVPDVIENKLSDAVISRGLGAAKYPNDKDAAGSFSTSVSNILEGLTTEIPSSEGHYNVKSNEWCSWSPSEKNQEEQVCEYFNMIARHVYEEYDIPEEHSRPRIFSDMFKNKAPKRPGVKCNRKPDGVVIDRAIADAAINDGAWSDIHALMELKESYTPKNCLEAYNQLLNCARLVFCSQMNRRFVLGVTLVGHLMTFYVFDRSGVLCSEKFDIMSNPEKLVRVVVGLLFADHTDLGYDPTIIIDHKAISEGTATEGKGKIIFNGVPYTIIDILYVEASVRGRGTTCFLVEYMGQLCVIKDSWVDDSRTRLEHEVLKKVIHVDGVPQIIAYENVKVRGAEDTTATDRRILENDNNWMNNSDWYGFEKAETRAHRRIMMTPYGEPLESFTSLVELLTAIKYIIETIESLNDEDVLHRDISIRNLVLALIDPKKPEKGRRGYIIDFDYAIFLKELLREPAKGHRTGTLPFMAVNMMVNENENKVPHAYYHDLESVLYVLCWICTTQEGPNNRSRSPSFKFSESEVALWAGYGRDDPDMRTISALKSRTVFNTRHFETNVLDQFAAYFAPLRNCIKSMRKLLIFSGSDFLEDEDETEDSKRSINTLKDWKKSHIGQDIPIQLLANIPPSQRNAKDVFGALYRIIDTTLATLVEPPAPSPVMTSVPDEVRDADLEESLTPQEIAQVKVVHIIDRMEAIREQKKAEEEEQKQSLKVVERMDMRDVRRSTRFARSPLSVASTSGTLLSSLIPSSTGTKRPTSPVELETGSMNSAKKRKYGLNQK